MNLTYRKTGALTEAKFREFFVPTVLASMAAQLGTIVNGIIVGNLIGPHAMAAVSACLPLSQITYAMATLISMGSAGLMAIAAGKRNNDEADYIFTSVVVVSMIFGAFWAFCLIPNVHYVSNFLSSAEDLKKFMDEYLMIFVFRVPLYLMFFSWQTLIRTDGFAKVVSRGIMIGQLTNVTLSFILVKNGFGVTGAGIALLLSDIVGICYILRNYYTSDERRRKFYPIFNNFAKFISQSFSVIKAGIPIASGTALISIKIWAIYQILAQTGGADAMTLYAICMACLSVISMCIAGCNGAMMPIVGMLYGEKDYTGVKILVKYVLRFAFMLSGIFVIFMLICPQAILSLYNAPPSMTEAGKVALRLFSVSLLGVTLTFLTMYYYTTIQQRLVANILSWTEGIIVVVPAAWLFSKTFGLNGVWLAFVLAELVGFIAAFLCVKYIRHNSKGKYRDIFLMEQNEPEMFIDVSFQADEDNASKIAIEVKSALEQRNFDKKVAIKVGVAVEEMTVNIAKLNPNRKISVDLRLKSLNDRIIIALRDNGNAFNPLEYSTEEKENLHTDGIMLLKALARDIKYNRVLSLNQTCIEM